MFCHKCGAQIDDDSRFCTRCGAEQHAHRPAEQPTQAAPQPAPATQPPASQTAAPQGSPRQPAAPPHPPAAQQPSFMQRLSSNPRAPFLLAGASAAVVVLIALALFTGMGSSGAGQTPVAQDPSAPVASGTAAHPSVQDAVTGKVVAAIERPTLIAAIEQVEEAAPTPNATTYTIDPDLSNVSNINHKMIYLTDSMKTRLGQYGFVIDGRYGNQEFFEKYESNRYNLIPNLVTVDSLMHTYHLYYQHLQKHTERDHLARLTLEMSKELLATSEEQLKALKGTEWEEAARRNVAFFAVGASLQDSSTNVPAEVSDVVKTELANIQAASSQTTSPLTGDPEDYSQYTVRGYYEGDAALEAYFRTMVWYGRINFAQKNEDLTRSALLMTMALQGKALENWNAIYAVTSFFAGASDDCGYCEYKPLIDAAYGEGASVQALAGNTEAWNHFQTLAAAMPAPQINSVPLGLGDDPNESRTEAEKGFRLMGQRFSLDGMIFTQLVNPEVGKTAGGGDRNLPDALDVPAALGSDAALAVTKERGASEYANYDTNIAALRSALSDETSEVWSASLYSQWLYTINPLLVPKGEGYPTFMQSDQWTRKSLQTYMGSYTELKHDSVLYSKQVMAEGGGGPTEKYDDRGYVEAEPQVFGRLANLTAATRDGLAGYMLISDADSQYLSLLEELAKRLETIANKELAGETPSNDEFELIRSYGEQLEHFWQETYREDAGKKNFTSQEYPAAIVADVATDGSSGTCLELGTGNAMTIYAIVPVDGSLRIAVGTTYSFYEFTQPISNRLTDSTWRQMLGIQPGSSGSISRDNIPDTQDWVKDFTVEGN